MMRRSLQRGFALLLVLGILAVAALIIGTVVARQETEATWAPVTGTKDQLDIVHRALAAYERTEHRLPMPAARTTDGGLMLHVEAISLLENNSPTATEKYSLPASVADQFIAGNISVPLAGGLVAASSDPQNLKRIMIVGAVPTETLGLPREAAEDKNGNLLTYAVTLEVVDPFKYGTAEGVIELKDADGQPVASKLAYIVLSHGKNAKGAWSAKGNRQSRECGDVTSVTGTASALEPELRDEANCMFTGATFVVNDLSLVRGEGYFDDQLLRGDKDRIATSQNRACIGPLNVTWGDSLCPTCQCDGVIPAPGLVSIATHSNPRMIDLEDADPTDIGEATFECTDGAVSIVANSNTCTRPCILPWGARIENGDSIAAYSVPSVTCGQSCPGPVMRMCVNGTLSGSGDYPGCTPSDSCTPATCALPWGGTLADGGSVQAYSTASVACDQSCPAPTTRVCTNGVLSGSGDHPACSPSQACSPSDCSLPWGGTLADGASVQAYSAASVVCGQTCAAPTTRSCTNGVLSGAGDHASCTVESCQSCSLPWGGTLAHGSSTTAYMAATVGCSQSCTPQTRTCTNGVLSGAGTNEGCSVMCSCTAWTRMCEPTITTNAGPNCEASGGNAQSRNCAVESTGSHPITYLCGGEARCDFRCCH